jgi:hypothetical protein
MIGCNPRETQCNLGHMVCHHRKYSLGDKHQMTVSEAIAKVGKPEVISLPLYLCDLPGGLMNTTGLVRDALGQVGYIYCTKAEAKEFFEVAHFTRRIEEEALERLRYEVMEYDDYLRGEEEEPCEE